MLTLSEIQDSSHRRRRTAKGSRNGDHSGLSGTTASLTSMSDARATGATAPRLGVADAVAARRARSTIALWVAGGLVAANVLLIVWLWEHGGNVTHVHSTGDFLVSIARLTGLLGAFSALLQVLLLARIPWLERAVGFDRLTVWHRWNGHACLVSRPRARRLLGLGLRRARQAAARRRRSRR